MGYGKFIGISQFYRDINKVPSGVKLISFIFIIYGISWGVIDPYFPIYLKENLASFTLIGLIYLALPLTTLFLSSPIGRFCDIIGKKKLIIIALFLYLFLGIFYMLSRSAVQFITTRIFHGIIYTLFWIPAMGLVRDFSGKKSVLAIGTFLGSYNFGTVIGSLTLAPMIASFFPLQYIFIPLIFTNFLSLLFFLKIPEGIKIKTRFRFKDIYEKGIRDFFKHRLSKSITFATFSLKFATVMIFIVLFLFLNDMGANFIQLAFFYAISTIPWAMQTYFADLAERFGKKRILTLGFLICFISLLLIFFTKDLVLLFILGIMASIAISMASPILEGLVTKLGLKREGEFTGVFEMIICIGGISGSLIGGILSDIFYLNFPFLITSLLFVVCILLFRRVKLQ